MSDELVFMMGQFAARFPTERQYARNHMWAQSHGEHIRFGFAAYAVRLLQDVYFLEWTVDAGTALRDVDPYGEGWLFAMEGLGTSLLSPAEYLVHLAASWAIAERTIKGQMNES
jgi:glycine cleavage system H protein